MRSDRGTTFLELTLTLVMVGVLAAMAIPRLEGLYGIRVVGAAEKVLGDIRYAQQAAMQRRIQTVAVFDIDHERYRVYQLSTGVNLDDPFTNSPGQPGQDWASGMVTDFPTHSELKGINIVSTTDNISGGLRFNSMGEPLDSTGARITSEATVLLSYDGFYRTIRIDPSGQIRFWWGWGPILYDGPPPPPPAGP